MFSVSGSLHSHSHVVSVKIRSNGKTVMSIKYEKVNIFVWNVVLWSDVHIRFMLWLWSILVWDGVVCTVKYLESDLAAVWTFFVNWEFDKNSPKSCYCCYAAWWSVLAEGYRRVSKRYQRCFLLKDFIIYNFM
jgi:hypothetical protein